MHRSSDPAPAPRPPALRPGGREAGPPWPGRAELRADLRGSLVLAAVLALSGLPAGLLWVALAPRARFDVLDDGPVVVGRPSPELLVADDAVYTLTMAALGLVAGGVAWALRRRRGVGTLLALAAGTLLAAVAAWRLGELLGPGPTAAELADVGERVTTGLSLGALPALAVAPLLAVLVYAVAALLSPAEDLDRDDPPPGTADGSATAGRTGEVPVLVDAPPPHAPGG